MAKYDYSSGLAMARGMIASYGRAVTLQGVSYELADDDNPLAGSKAPPAEYKNVPAVFVQPSSLNLLGSTVRNVELFKECSQIAIISPLAGADYSDVKFMEDGGTTWKVQTIEIFKPGDVTLLYFMGVVAP